MATDERKAYEDDIKARHLVLCERIIATIKDMNADQDAGKDNALDYESRILQMAGAHHVLSTADALALFKWVATVENEFPFTRDGFEAFITSRKYCDSIPGFQRVESLASGPAWVDAPFLFVGRSERYVINEEDRVPEVWYVPLPSDPTEEQIHAAVEHLKDRTQATAADVVNVGNEDMRYKKVVAARLYNQPFGAMYVATRWMAKPHREEATDDVGDIKPDAEPKAETA